jgi:hypothetical protein
VEATRVIKLQGGNKAKVTITPLLPIRTIQTKLEEIRMRQQEEIRMRRLSPEIRPRPEAIRTTRRRRLEERQLLHLLEVQIRVIPKLEELLELPLQLLLSLLL